MSLGGLGNEGDNIEFTAVGIDDYTIFFQHNDNTSADDTATIKYPNNTTTARNFQIRVDKNSDLLQMNERVFTNPVQITADQSHIEKRTVPMLSKIIIRTNATNTTIKVRWF